MVILVLRTFVYLVSSGTLLEDIAKLRKRQARDYGTEERIRETFTDTDQDYGQIIQSFLVFMTVLAMWF
jgi:hypothetical protein